MAECSICLNDCEQFKSLECGHFYCISCTADLIGNGHRLAAGDQKQLSPSTSQTTTTIDNGDKELEASIQRTSILCPKCRHMTTILWPANQATALHCLRSKFFRYLVCVECDDRKLVSEFRWCRLCIRSVCSRCFIEHHLNETTADQPASLHPSSKWEDFEPVRQCLDSLRTETAGIIDKTAATAKRYLATYLEGLKEYLELEIDQMARTEGQVLTSKLDSIADSYGMNASQPNTCKIEQTQTNSKADNNKLKPLLDDVIAVAGITELEMPICDWKPQIQSVPYAEISNLLLGSNRSRANKRQQSSECAQPIRIGNEILTTPVDFDFLPQQKLLITDMHCGVYILGRDDQLEKIPLHHTYQQYSHIQTLQKGAFAIVSVKIYNRWAFLILFWDQSRQSYRQFKHNQAFHVHYATNQDFCFALAENDKLFACSLQKVWLFESIQAMSWKEIYSLDAEGGSPQLLSLGAARFDSGLSQTTLFFANNTSKCVDQIIFDNQFNVISRCSIQLPSECLNFNAFGIAKFKDNDARLLIFDGASSVVSRWSLEEMQVKSLMTKFPPNSLKKAKCTDNQLWAIVGSENDSKEQWLQRECFNMM